MASFSGPLPAPLTLHQYNQIIPNGAERITVMAESQSAHRKNLESWVVKGGVIRQYVGLVFALLLLLVALYFAVDLAREGHTAVALAILGMPLTAIVSVFVLGQKSSVKERSKRDQKNRDSLHKTRRR